MPTSSKTRSWAGVPAAERRDARRGLLLDAAYDLLGTEGWAGTTVRAVCHRAHLNPRYFYESFGGLDQLVVAVYDRVVAELAGKVMAAVEDAPVDPRQQTRAAIEATVRFVDEDHRRGRVMYVEALGNEALNRRRLDAGHELVEVIERDASARHGAIGDGDPVGRLGAAILVGGFSELLVGWIEGRIDVARDQLVDDATTLFLAVAEAAARVATRRAR